MTWATLQGKLGHRQGDIVVALRNGTTDTPEAINSDQGKMHVIAYVWNPNTLAFEVSTGGITPGTNVAVTNLPSDQLVHATTLPLPTGASTETSLAAVLAQLTGADTRAIDTVHNRVHEGRFFSGGYYNAAVADTATLDILIQSSATLSTHMRFEGAAGGDALLQIYKGTTFSAVGTAIPMSNHNDTSAKAFSGTVTHTPTITAVGTALNDTKYVPGGQKAQSGGGAGSFGSEFVLAANTVYLFRLTNIGGAAKRMSASIEGYQPNL